MKFLIETLDTNQVQVLEEAQSDGGKKNLYITGPFIQMECVNGNKRLYPEIHTAPAVDKYIAEKVDTKRALGELNHPDNPVPNPRDAAILITSLKRQSNDYIGKALVLEELPMGKIVGGLLRAGVQLAVSSRGVGSVRLNEKGINVVQPDFVLTTAADVVYDPSAPDAFVTAINENREWAFVDGRIQEVAAKRILDETARKGQNYLIAMQKIISLLS